LKVVGIFEVHVYPLDRTWGFAPVRIAQSIFGFGSGFSDIGVRAVDPKDAPRLAARVESLTGYDAESWQEVNAANLSVFALQNLVVNCQIGAILVVGGFGILAVQIMIVLQRVREISILRSVGWRRSDILTMFLFQGAILASLGAVIGDFAGWRTVALLGRMYDPTAGYHGGAQLRVEDSAQAYVWGAFFALAMGIAASVIPAWRASRVEPVDTLRGQIG
jgi:lipoprotein-releasing system permease protein